MKFSHLLLLAAGVPLLASAQAQQAMPAAADANAPVAPLQYQSVFAGSVGAKEAPQPPEKGWVRANRALLDEEATFPMSGEQSTAPVPQKTTKTVPAHDKHKHEGVHQ